ncbi:hypothetical protein SAMN05216198_1693 [Halopseudomonas litoralis]|uniref:Uncharacterized protein n=1 Tax=Halopseudomonas litoralis TaxID=797277 RepID=A0A1H1RBS5_9GAMM|nr:hypothetical protein SAMN05216198_1693 [Halopseudomonas litoralis]
MNGPPRLWYHFAFMVESLACALFEPCDNPGLPTASRSTDMLNADAGSGIALSITFINSGTSSEPHYDFSFDRWLELNE